jgi:hypothetical protein
MECNTPTRAQVQSKLEVLKQRITSAEFAEPISGAEPVSGVLGRDTAESTIAHATTALDQTKNNIEEWDVAQLKRGFNAATGTAKAISDSIDVLKSGDGIRMAKAAANIMGAASAFGLLGRPPGMIAAAAVVGPIRILTGAILDHVYGEEFLGTFVAFYSTTCEIT